MCKRQLFLLFLAAAMSCSFCGCSAKEEKSLPQLMIGCNDYEPYNYTDEDGEPAGIDVELAEEACRRMGYEAVFRQIDWNNRDTLLKEGEIDCLWSCFSMDGQEEDYDWAGPYMNSRQVVAVLYDSPIQSLSDLEGRSLGVRAGAKAESIFLNRTDSDIPQVRNIYSLNSTDELVTALRNDYVDAIAGYAATLRETLRNDGIAYRFLEEDLSQASLGVAFAKGKNTELQEKLSETLKEMLSDGTTKQILEGYNVNTGKVLGGLMDE